MADNLSTLKSTTVRKPGHKRFGGFQVYLGAGVSIAALIWLFRSVHIAEILDRVREVRPELLLLAVLLTMVSYLLRSWRWPLFFDNRALSFWGSFRCIMVGFFMNNVLPARMGEFVRAHLGGKVLHQRRTIVLATIAGERLIDGLMISLIFAVFFSFFARADEQAQGQALYLVSYAFLAAGVGAVVVLANRKTVFRILDWIGKRMGKFAQFTIVRARHFIEGLEPMFRRDRLILLILSSLSIWFVEFFVYALVAKAFHTTLSLAGLSLFLAASNFSSLIPAAPGGVGVIEAFATAALVHIGVDRETALAMVASQHLIQIAVVGVPGSFLFFYRLHGKIPGEEGEVDAAEEENASHSSMQESSSQARNVVNFSVVVPAFNEENRLRPTVESIVSYFRSRRTSFEVLVVDDGSLDGTSNLVKSLHEKFSEVSLLSYGENRGKGYAIRHGIQRAAGELVLFDDADGSTPIEEIERLERALNNHSADIAIGSRALASKETKVEALWHRKVMGRVFNVCANVLLVPGISDTQCGFKLFRRAVAHDLFARQCSDRFAFDVEVLYLARKLGYRVEEVAVNWHNMPGSQISLVGDSAVMFLDLLKFRVRDLVGGYELSKSVEGQLRRQ